MAEGTGLSAGDIMALTKNDGSFGQNWIWIIGLLIVAGIFGNGFGFGNNNTGVTEEYIAGQFNSRDVWATNQNVSTTANATQMEILNSRANCNNNYSNLRYDTAVGQANLDKDILLGNQTIQSQMAQNALQAQANLDSCCCTLRTEMQQGIQSIKDLINGNTIQDLRDEVAGYRETLSNANQSQNLLNAIGTWRANPPYPYYNYGTTIA